MYVLIQNIKGFFNRLPVNGIYIHNLVNVDSEKITQTHINSAVFVHNYDDPNE